MILDPLKPYLHLITVALCTALICGAFVAGCNHGESNKEKEVAAVVAANKSSVAAGEEANKQEEANKRFAAEQMKEAERLARELNKKRSASDNVISKQDKQLQKAKENPTCAAFLEQHYCASAPVYSLD